MNYWKDQVKQIMSANIDTLYVHMYGTQDRTQRQNLFTAMSQLRAQGYDVPKVAPWLDGDGLANVVDLATPAGKDTFINTYKTFFTDYYAANPDAAADSYLHQVNGKVVLNTWQTRSKFINHASLTRADVENSLKATYAAAHPMFNNGIRVTSLVYIDPNIGFIDEMIPQYQDTDPPGVLLPGQHQPVRRRQSALRQRVQDGHDQAGLLEPEPVPAGQRRQVPRAERRRELR